MPLSLSQAQKLRGTVSGNQHRAQSLKLTSQVSQITEMLHRWTLLKLNQLTSSLAAFHVRTYH